MINTPWAKSSAAGFALICLLGSFTGCTTTENYHRPSAIVPSAWPASPDSDAPKTKNLVHWRTLFPDPQLDALIEIALANNRDVRIAAARVEEARAQFGVAEANTLPSINANLGQESQGYPRELSGRDKPFIYRKNEFSLGLVSYEVDFWGKFRNLSESARANVLASEASSRAVSLSLVSEVANTYFLLLELNQRLAFLQTKVDIQDTKRNLTLKAKKSGFATQSTLLGSQEAFESSLSDLSSTRRQQLNAENKLRALLGGELPNFTEENSRKALDIEADIAPGLPSEVLLSRPDIIAAEQRLIGAHANIQAARAAFLPKILLTASLGLASPALSSLVGSGARTWAFQPLLSQPLFDGGRNEATVDVAIARKNIAVAEYEKAIQEAFREVADLLAAQVSATEQRQSLESTLQSKLDRLSIAEARFRAGMSSQMDIYDARIELLGARQNALQAKRVQLGIAAQLYKALGGDTKAQ